MSNSPDRSSKWAIPFLLFGGFLAGWGWVVGLVLLWRSEAWTLGEKLLGTFVTPFGLAGSLWFASALAGGTSQTGGCPTPQLLAHRCVSGGTYTVSHNPSVFADVGAVLILIAPIVVAFYVYRHRRAPVVAAPAAA